MKKYRRGTSNATISSSAVVVVVVVAVVVVVVVAVVVAIVVVVVVVDVVVVVVVVVVVFRFVGALLDGPVRVSVEFQRIVNDFLFFAKEDCCFGGWN